MAEPARASETYRVEVESRPGVEDRAAREVLLNLAALGTGSAGSYDVTVQKDDREVGRLDGGTDYTTAVGLRDLLRQRASQMSPQEFAQTYSLRAEGTPVPAVRTAAAAPWTAAQRRHATRVVAPTFLALFLLAVLVAVWMT